MRNSRGFTIVELLIVIVVIGILAAITIAAFNGIQDRAKFSQKRADLASINKAIKLYYADVGSYPISPSTPTPGGFVYQRMASTDDAFIPGLAPKYISKLPSITDGPTGAANNNTFIYSSNGTSYTLQRLYQLGTTPQTMPSGEWNQVPTDLKQGGNLDRWGFSG